MSINTSVTVYCFDDVLEAEASGHGESNWLTFKGTHGEDLTIHLGPRSAYAKRLAAAINEAAKEPQE